MEYATRHKRDVRGAIMDENSYMSAKNSMYVRLWQIWGNLIAGVLLKYYICHLKHGEGKVGALAVPRFILMADYVRVLFLKHLIVKYWISSVTMTV